MIHVLPGDALTETFKSSGIEGEIIVCRECLIDGNVKSENLADFWNIRAEFIANEYDTDENSYDKTVVKEFEKLLAFAEKEDEVCLWFEYDLFCQINMWFCLFLLEDTATEIYRIAPIVRNEQEIWKGFGEFDGEDLQRCFEQKTKFGKSDILLGKNLWEAYQIEDFAALKQLSQTESKSFPKLAEVCQAEIEKQIRPKEVLKEIIAKGETDFAKIFEAFIKTEGIYGFGDLQVKKMLQEI